MTTPSVPPTRSAGDSGHIADHNQITSDLTTLFSDINSLPPASLIVDNGDGTWGFTTGVGGTGGGGTGSQGSQGAPGSNGSQGPQGTPGTNGSQGSQGPQGTTGPQGATGTGSTGPQGSAGSQGPQGTQGATGSGAAGPTGPAGPVGLNNRGTYSGSTTYAANDAVTYTVSSVSGYFLCLVGTTGNAPPTPTASGASNTYWQQIGFPGSQGPAGSGSLGVITPSDMGFVSWTSDYQFINGVVAAYHGQLFGSAIKLNAGQVTTGVMVDVEVAGSGMTTGQNFIGLYNPSGTLVATTADQTTAWGSAGYMIPAAWTSSFTVATTGVYYLGILIGGTTATSPQFGVVNSGRNNIPVNAQYSLPTSLPARFGQIGSGAGMTALPSTVNYAANNRGNAAYWFGLY